MWEIAWKTLEQNNNCLVFSDLVLAEHRTDLDKIVQRKCLAHSSSSSSLWRCLLPQLSGEGSCSPFLWASRRL